MMPSSRISLPVCAWEARGGREMGEGGKGLRRAKRWGEAWQGEAGAGQGAGDGAGRGGWHSHLAADTPSRAE